MSLPPTLLRTLALHGALAFAPVTWAQAPRPAPTWSSALFVELSSAWVPYANNVPLMASLGLRFADVHEVWARAGYMPVGDDAGHGFGALGYRAALRPRRVVRPLVGGLFAALPATCAHDDAGNPVCTGDPLFVLAATGGVRFEPAQWFGVSATLALGIDSYPNPFGMIELAATFALPLS